jgi:hypothetical protein
MIAVLSRIDYRKFLMARFQSLFLRRTIAAYFADALSGGLFALELTKDRCLWRHAFTCRCLIRRSLRS